MGQIKIAFWANAPERFGGTWDMGQIEIAFKKKGHQRIVRVFMGQNCNDIIVHGLLIDLTCMQQENALF